jgi:hypothetical protein
MTTPKALLVACALLMGTAALADPVLTIDRAGLKKGVPGTLTLRLSNVVDNVSAYQIIIQFPPGAVTVREAGISTAASPGTWDTPVTNWEADKGKLWLVSASVDGQGNGVLITVPVTLNVDSLGVPVLFDPETNIADVAWNGYYLTGSSVIVNGAVKKVGAGAKVAAAPGTVAVAAGTKLYVLDSALVDKPGFEGGKDLGGTASGRPAIKDGLIAVGTAEGTGKVYSDTGQEVASVSLGGPVKAAPAITPLGIYWPVEKASGPALVFNGVETSLGAAGDKLTSSPAVFGGKLFVGTDKAAKVLNVDATGALTPQADMAAGENFSTSPFIMAGGNGVVAAGSKVWPFVAATGAPGAPVNAPTALSDPVGPFAGPAVFGGADGKVYTLTGGATEGAAFGAAPVVPVVPGAPVWAADTAGKFGKVGGDIVDLAGAVAGGVVTDGTNVLVAVGDDVVSVAK